MLVSKVQNVQFFWSQNAVKGLRLFSFIIANFNQMKNQISRCNKITY